MPKVLAALTEYGYDTEHLTAERAKMRKFTIDQWDRQEMGEGCGAAGHGGIRRRPRRNWVAQYVKSRRWRCAVADKLWKRIGVLARTSKTAARQAGPQKAAMTSEEEGVTEEAGCRTCEG